METHKKGEHYLDYIDIAKGVAIILVIIGHTIRDEMIDDSLFYGAIKNIIYSFQVPLFMFLSGLMVTWKEGRYKFSPDFIKKKIYSLMIPFVSYSALLYIVFEIANLFPICATVLHNAGFEKKSIAQYIYSSLFVYNPYSQHLWFLWVLFLFQCTVFLLTEIVLKKQKLFVQRSVVLIVAVLAILTYYCEADILMTYRVLMDISKSFIFFATGTMISSNIKRYFRAEMSAIGIICILIVSIYAIQEKMELGLASVMIKCVICLLTIISLIAVVYWCQLLSGKISNVLQHLGRKSFLIYLLHQPLCAFLGALLYNRIGVGPIIVIILCAAVSVIFPLFAEWIACKSKVTRKIGVTFFNICR